jgi:hypothetical protein
LGLVVLTVLLAAAVPAGVARAQLERGISDADYFNDSDPAIRELGLARAGQAGARFVRIQLSWRYVSRRAPASSTEAQDPGWGGYNFDYVDRVLGQIAAAGLEPLVTVRHAPAWFEAPGRWRFAAPGTWAPSPPAFGDFAVAVARRYSGEFPDPERKGETLPRVRHWQVWNEPNLPGNLQPQWIARDGRWAPFSPTHYRRLLVAFEAGIRSRLPDAVVVTAGAAPTGEPDGVGRMAPVRFWQSFFCLGRPPRLSPSPCPDVARFDVFAHHPFSTGDPDAARRSSADVSVADLHRLVSILRTAERTGRAEGARRHPLWVTELNWNSRPPDPDGLTPRLQHRYVARALYRLAAEGVRVAFWHFISDRPNLPHRPGGLWRDDPRGLAYGRPKPALSAFRFPFVVVRGSERQVRVWGLVPRPGARRVTIERRRRGRWSRVATVPVSAAGVIGGRLALRGSATLRARAEGSTSPGWRVGSG